jgi:ATP-dependent helicase HrpB
VARTEARLGGVVVARHEGPPGPGPDTEAALVERVRATRLGALGPDDGVRSLQQRVAFVRGRGHREPPDLPDLSDAALLADLDGWLPPFLAGATGRADLDRLDLEMVLLSRIGFDDQRELDRLAPRRLRLPTGRDVEIDYGGDAPSVRVRVQEVFGLSEHPTVLGGAVPVVLHLLSPADRPVQVTADLPGFWAGSWAEVRKDMAGRYPKHAWPEDPASAEPHRR